ncbi:MAG TPA: hypothetical protein VMH35_10250 [Streptosporangiaceae bacterium]|nr:hypothetical protein [Streptosporangiaceae bacterium]
MARATRLTVVSLAGVALAAYAGLQVLGRMAGTTGAERRQRLPGDELVDPATIVTEHAIDVAGEPEEVWPWLMQLGWHLGGYYIPQWVDRLLFPANWPSLDRLDPALVRDLRAGDLIPDGPPGTAFYRVTIAEAPHLLVLRSTTHLPPGWERHGAAIDWTWCFSLSRPAPRRTRVRLRVRARTVPWWLTALYLAGLVPADYVMAMGMLRGLKRRVEAHRGPAASGRDPFDQAAYQIAAR